VQASSWSAAWAPSPPPPTRSPPRRRRPTARARTRRRPGGGVGYGPLVTDPKGLLSLPAGFSYRVITYSGRTKLDSGEFTPSNHDGTSTFDGPRGATLLVNNHELKGPRAAWTYPVPLTEGLVYDPAASGGCTVVEVRHDQVAIGVSPVRA
jgi:secreted PhoX family phosphatase